MTAPTRFSCGLKVVWLLSAQVENYLPRNAKKTSTRDVDGLPREHQQFVKPTLPKTNRQPRAINSGCHLAVQSETCRLDCKGGFTSVWVSEIAATCSWTLFGGRIPRI
jgi:hypothetical protein